MHHGGRALAENFALGKDMISTGHQSGDALVGPLQLGGAVGKLVAAGDDFPQEPLEFDDVLLVLVVAGEAILPATGLLHELVRLAFKAGNHRVELESGLALGEGGGNAAVTGEAAHHRGAVHRESNNGREGHRGDIADFLGVVTHEPEELGGSGIHLGGVAVILRFLCKGVVVSHGVVVSGPELGEELIVPLEAGG